MWSIAAVAALMLLIAGFAFGIPLAGYPDCTDGCAPAAYRDRLRAQASLMSDLPMLKLQVVEAAVEGPNPEEVSGRVAVRSLFGVRTGTVTTADGRSHHAEISLGKEAGLWGGLLAAEALLGILLLRLLWTHP